MTFPNSGTLDYIPDGAVFWAKVGQRDLPVEFKKATIEDVQAGTDDESYLTSLKGSQLIDAKFANQSLTENGYAELPGGRVEQWGYYPGGSHGPRINFPIAFPVETLNIVCTSTEDNSSVRVAPESITSTSFSVTQLITGPDGSSNSSSGIFWRAIGH